MSNVEKSYEQLCQHLREAALIGSLDALAGYDEQTVMPPAAADYRGEQSAFLSGMMHDKLTDPRIGQWLDELKSSDLTKDKHSDSAAVIRETARDHAQRTRIPKKLVEELARTKVQAQQTWIAARKANDFVAFAPMLSKMVQLKREEASVLRDVLREQEPNSNPTLYDALLDQYEPGAKSVEVGKVLKSLRDELVPLIKAITASKHKPNSEILARHYPRVTQEQFGSLIAKRVGFDFNRGRLDVTAHPFCSEMGPHDKRITTRYNENEFNSAFFGILHETGHSLYEQGLRPEWYGLPPGVAISLGIHESQSRLWENQVGRSHAFWQYVFPLAKEAFPAALGDVALDDFYKAVNTAEPSLIRVEADEATYNLHILIRFEIEHALINDNLSVNELPSLWNSRYESDLGVKPPSDAMGVMQDVHWSAGLFGYFATYSLGNLYSAQLFATADRDLGGLNAMFAKGEFQPLLDWLRQKIHRHGRTWTASELVESVTGRSLSSTDLMQYLKGKYGPIYQL